MRWAWSSRIFRADVERHPAVGDITGDGLRARAERLDLCFEKTAGREWQESRHAIDRGLVALGAAERVVAEHAAELSGKCPRCLRQLPRKRTWAVLPRLFRAGGFHPVGRPVLEFAHPSASMSWTGAAMLLGTPDQCRAIATHSRASQQEL